MSKANLGKNIRALRNAYGETQEELGIAINVEKNTISHYENGKREPSMEILREIAKHYIVSVEEMTSSDLSGIGSITVDNKVFIRRIDYLLPLVSSESAMKNTDFKKAYESHKRLYNFIRESNFDYDIPDICFEEYNKAMDENAIECEVAANLLALFYLVIVSLKTFPIIYQNQTAALMQVFAKDKHLKEILENRDDDFFNDVKEYVAELYDTELVEYMEGFKKTIKKSPEWSDLADYYLALQYAWSIVDNDLELAFNSRIGTEMMKAFASVGNKYAENFLLFCLESQGQSSQTVDDR